MVTAVPKVSSSIGIESLLYSLPGKTFTTPVCPKSAPVLSGKGMEGNLGGLPGKTFNSPFFSTPAPTTINPAAKSRTGFGSYLNGL